MTGSRPAAGVSAESLVSPERSSFGYRRIVLLLVGLVVVPTGLLLAVGLVLLFLGGAQLNILLGIFVLALSGAVVTGVILIWVFVRREAKLSQLQSDFVSKVSHELRTPLTSIRLFSETLALRREDDKAVDTCIEGLHQEVSRLQELIVRLLDWGRMESGQRQYHMQATRAVDIVREAVDDFEPQRERQSAQLEVEVEDGLPVLFAEKASVRDAVFNLLTNAGKYGGSPPQIHVRVYGQNDKICIAVEDNGSGIPVGEHKRIFRKFYRVDDRLSRRKEGSGLGLAIAKHVVRAHKGRIELKSEPGQGSTFTLVLPTYRHEAGQ